MRPKLITAETRLAETNAEWDDVTDFEKTRSDKIGERDHAKNKVERQRQQHAATLEEIKKERIEQTDSLRKEMLL